VEKSVHKLQQVKIHKGGSVSSVIGVKVICQEKFLCIKLLNTEEEAKISKLKASYIKTV
jgi:hypothetical protein